MTKLFTVVCCYGWQGWKWIHTSKNLTFFSASSQAVSSKIWFALPDKFQLRYFSQFCQSILCTMILTQNWTEHSKIPVTVPFERGGHIASASYIAHLFSSLAHFSINLGTIVRDLLLFPNAHRLLSTKGFLKPLIINLQVQEKKTLGKVLYIINCSFNMK